jgi:hypothetical protein
MRLVDDLENVSVEANLGAAQLVCAQYDICLVPVELTTQLERPEFHFFFDVSLSFGLICGLWGTVSFSLYVWWRSETTRTDQRFQKVLGIPDCRRERPLM